MPEQSGRRIRKIREGDSYQFGEDVEKEEIAPPDPYPENQVDEPWETDKVPIRKWISTADPRTWKDRSHADL